MAHARTTIDLDAKLADLGIEDEPIHTAGFRLFGRDWTLVCDVNMFNLATLAEGDPAAIIGFFDNVIHPDEIAEFKATLRRQKNFDGPKLGAILNLMVEAATERPTKQPSGSLSGATKRTSKPRSTANSSRAAVRSVR